MDHARCLAEQLAQALELPCAGLLARRDEDAVPQHTLSRAERLRHARDAFCPPWTLLRRRRHAGFAGG